MKRLWYLMSKNSRNQLAVSTVAMNVRQKQIKMLLTSKSRKSNIRIQVRAIWMAYNNSRNYKVDIACKTNNLKATYNFVPIQNCYNVCALLLPILWRCRRPLSKEHKLKTYQQDPYIYIGMHLQYNYYYYLFFNEILLFNI